jgi:hypothetical protein
MAQAQQAADLEQLNLQRAIQEAQAEGAPNENSQLIVLGNTWLEKQRRKLNKQNFPRFCNRAGEDWDGHKTKMANAFRIARHHPSDQEGRKGQYIMSLDGEAFQMAREVADNQDALTLEQVMDRLDAIFLAPSDSDINKDAYKQLSQGKNEIPQTYLAKKEQMWLKAYSPDNRDPGQFRKEVTLGLRHREVRKRVFCQLPSITSMGVLRNVIMNEIATQRQLIHHGDAEDTSMDGLATSNRVIYRNDGTEDMEVNAVGDGTSSVKCYNCNQTGHYSRNCPKKKQQASKGTGGATKDKPKGNCRRCGTPGHWQKTCTIPEDRLANVRKRNQEKNANSGGRGRQHQDRGRHAVREMRTNEPGDTDSGVGDDDQAQFYGDVNCLEAVGHRSKTSKNVREGSRR